MKLTDFTCKNLKPKNKSYKKSDGRGLFMLIQPNGSKLSIRKQKQKEAVSRILANLKAQANTIAQNAQQVSSKAIAPVQVERPNSMWAVVIYAPAAMLK
ncbi:MAG: Arm DNA-binding domain-containing protein [Pseudomonadota bacterium]